MSATTNNNNDGGKKAAWNIVGAIAGALLAAVAIFGLVQQQSSVSQPQTYKAQINYDQ
ncbi:MULTISPECIES: DUF2613 family protein [unclassified Yimella]|uniref:DUF2613 family protein n=1 Tax=unclassified Yimella TaxID=2649892 RepID=UPI00101C50ED|nr:MULTISPECIES: DUF2613 family protein [unclassified Yimella]MCG8655198.1 DUF2613 family protein [Yimella sp. NH-Cas1]RYG77754.1 DUF2613 family protein [Yimella sp. RIT 621]